MHEMILRRIFGIESRGSVELRFLTQDDLAEESEWQWGTGDYPNWWSTWRGGYANVPEDEWQRLSEGTVGDSLVGMGGPPDFLVRYEHRKAGEWRDTIQVVLIPSQAADWLRDEIDAAVRELRAQLVQPLTRPAPAPA